MKLTFFLIAFFLVLLRVCVFLPGHNDSDHGTMVIKSDNYIEEIRWSGRVRLSEDERSIAEMPPGAYLKFRENDQTLTAESNLQGEISYSLYDGHDNLPLNDSGRRFIAGVLHKMIDLGFYSDGRAQRIYRKGGDSALLAELTRIRMGANRDSYLDLLFKSDSLTRDQRIRLLDIAAAWNDDQEEKKVLNRFSPDQLRDSVIGQRWLALVSQVSDEDMKKDLLARMDTAALPPARFDSILAITGRMNDAEVKKDIYGKLISAADKTDEQWISLIRAVAGVDDDDLKAGLLRKIGSKMPGQDRLKAEWLTAARTVKDDAEYGKLMRSMQ